MTKDEAARLERTKAASREEAVWNANQAIGLIHRLMNDD